MKETTKDQKRPQLCTGLLVNSKMAFGVSRNESFIQFIHLLFSSTRHSAADFVRQVDGLNPCPSRNWLCVWTTWKDANKQPIFAVRFSNG